MPVVSVDPLLDFIHESAFRITGDAVDLDPLMDTIGDAQFVLLGEATHGTHEFYRARAELTRRLIEEKDFAAVAVEADWPDAYRVNRYVRGLDDDSDAAAALGNFKRFPTWMWRNVDVFEFVEWLRARNQSVSVRRKTGFYGLDLYSLNSSIHAVLRYLDERDPDAARRARYRYSCFEDYGEDTQKYGYAANFSLSDSCEREAVEQLVELRRHAADLMQANGRAAQEEFFFAEQNARVVKNAEQYYRTMFRGQIESWNLRDRHMFDTLRSLVAHLERDFKRPRIVLWAHNSHLGDARATQQGWRGEWNVGQLVREHYGEAAVLIGFTTFSGVVTAASDWDGATERKCVRPALRESYERLFHETGLSDFYLLLRDGSAASRALREARLERAIGVVYRPKTERLSHYFEASLQNQFDALIHFDETHAVEPLERTPVWMTGEPPLTYPTA